MNTLTSIAGNHLRTLADEDLQNISVVKNQIQLMCEADQLARNTLKEDMDDSKAIEFLENMDIKHSEQLKKILSVHGWLTISKFGEEIDKCAWLLVQHADHDPAFQASVAFLLQLLVSLKETDPKNFAYLYDRVAVKYKELGAKQRYGTQARIARMGI